MPVVRPFEHHPGPEPGPDPEAYRSDDCLWFFNAVPAYVAETGDLEFYDKVLPYADQGEATVFGHLRRALEFNLERTGKHGLPCGLAADLNDCLRFGCHGESLFVAFHVRLGLTIYAEIAQRLDKSEESAWALAQRETLDASIQACAWDGDWFIWAIGEDGTVYGTRTYEEGQVYLNTQLWAVISGAATTEQASRCMQTVQDRLDEKWQEVDVELKAKQVEITGGCVYYQRCPVADKDLGCDLFRPTLLEIEADHFVACFRYADR
jgi:N,N'-diacetylchitobiose phosphorylase